ncbi:hypothetical protein D3C76_1545780 [compost metagenome]
MVTDKESVIRGDGALVEDAERGFEMRGASGYQRQRSLLRVLHQGPWACGNTDVLGGFFGRLDQAG